MGHTRSLGGLPKSLSTNIYQCPNEFHSREIRVHNIRIFEMIANTTLIKTIFVEGRTPS